MKNARGALTFFLITSLGLACSDGALNSKNTGMGGRTSVPGSGGRLGSGGAGSGGAVAGGSGGSTASGAGGIGGRGGSNAGGITGAGGATCLPTLCVGVACPGGYVPNPDPCGCPICPVPDAGGGKDSATDTACIQPPCAAIKCKAGDQLVTPTCGCPTCVPGDAGPPDAIDAAVEKPQATCTNLDACACMKSDACAPITETCYCPYPQCGSNGACICGGGKYLGCAPAGLATCAGAKAQVAALCPTLKGTTFDSLCAQANSACITKCLGDVTSCSDVFCSFCEACDCAGDSFSQCVASCTSALAQK
jgi:hypothetical protein